MPTLTHASEPRPVATTLVAACRALARLGIVRNWHRDHCVARVGVVGPKQAAHGAWHDVVLRPSSLGNPSERVAARLTVSEIQRLCRWSLRDALAGDPPAAGNGSTDGPQ